MHGDDIREHIEAAARSGDRETRGVIARLSGACWPGGIEDRLERGALAWVRHWRPAKTTGVLPVCSCGAGRCAVCN